MYDDFDDLDDDEFGGLPTNATRRLGRAAVRDRRAVRQHGFVGARILKPGGTAQLRRS